MAALVIRQLVAAARSQERGKTMQGMAQRQQTSQPRLRAVHPRRCYYSSELPVPSATQGSAVPHGLHLHRYLHGQTQSISLDCSLASQTHWLLPCSASSTSSSSSLVLRSPSSS